MGILLPDLIVEITLRDGLEFLKQNPDTLDDIFSELAKPYNSRKYGTAEIDKIKTLIQTKNIAVVHSFYEAAAKNPCFSVTLDSESEAKNRAHLGDFEEDVRETFTEPADIASTVKISGLVPTAYDATSGKVSVDDSVDVSLIATSYIYEDGSGTEFTVKSGQSNVDGNKFFFIDKNASPDIVNPGEIRTFLNFEQYERKGDTSEVSVTVGVHSKEALVTKFLYAIVKYIMKSRKDDLIKRCFINSTFSGSGFGRDLEYQGDIIFTRYFTLKGQVDDTWRSDNVDLIDQVEIDATPVDCPPDEEV